MLRSGNFWAGAVTGIVIVYAYQMYKMKKMSQG